MSTGIVVTGTGNPAAHPTRAGAGVLVRHQDIALQFDVGRSTVLRLAAASCAPTYLSAVLLTHHHSDHVVGLTDLLLTRWLHAGQDGEAVPVLGPAGPLDRLVPELLVPFRVDIDDRIAHRGGARPIVDWRPFAAHDEPTRVWARGAVEVHSALVDHGPLAPAVGYRVTTPDGVVAISGDTRVCDGVARLAEGARVLVHEAMLGHLVTDRAVADYHSDAQQVGEQAASLGIETLVLTHLIPAPDVPAVRQGYVDAVRAGGFTGVLHVADDLLEVVLA